ncbi:MAG: FAD-dependent thymidylate synthase [bacterium]
MVKLINYTTNPEITIAIAARLCYSSSDITKIEYDFKEDEKGLEKARKLIKKIRTSGHESVLEHANFTFIVDKLSRSASHQLVRHRIASYSQRSQRYVKETNPQIIIPESISENKEFLDKFNNLVKEIYSLYGFFLEKGMPAEDARYILPNAAQTQLSFTMNARELLHFFRLRGCERAQWEIRNLAKEVFKLVFPIAPSVFYGAGPSCVRSGCSEGEFSCGRPLEIKKEWTTKGLL